MIDTVCRDCGSQMKEMRTQEIVGTVYHYLRCEKCRKEVARRE